MKLCFSSKNARPCSVAKAKAALCVGVAGGRDLTWFF